MLLSKILNLKNNILRKRVLLRGMNGLSDKDMTGKNLALINEN